MWYKVINDALAATSLARPKLPGISNCTDAQLLAAHWVQYAGLPPALQAVIDAEKQAALAAYKEIQRDMDQYEMALKAVALVVLAEVNLVREWLSAYKTQVAAATSLANLQDRVAAMPAMPERTVDQLKAAVRDKVTALQS